MKLAGLGQTGVLVVYLVEKRGQIPRYKLLGGWFPVERLLDGVFELLELSQLASGMES